MKKRECNKKLLFQKMENLFTKINHICETYIGFFV